MNKKCQIFTPENYVIELLDSVGYTENLYGKKILDKTTPRLIQFHTLKNAANPPLLGGFSIFGTVAA